MLMPTVHRYMTFDPYTVSARDSMTTAHRIMREHDIRHLPVVDDTRLVGIVSDRDLRLRAVSSDPDAIAVQEVMTTCVLSVTPHTPLDEAIELMSTARCNSLVVIGKDGVVGILTASDALFALTDLLRRNAA